MKRTPSQTPPSPTPSSASYVHSTTRLSNLAILVTTNDNRMVLEDRREKVHKQYSGIAWVRALELVGVA